MAETILQRIGLDRIGRVFRSSIESPNIPISSKEILKLFHIEENAAGVAVNVDRALGVSGIWSAVNFLSSTRASLPCHVYKRNRNGDKEKVGGGLETMLHDAPNPYQTSYDCFKYLFDRFYTDGRGLAWIERRPSGEPVYLWPLVTSEVTVKRSGGILRYQYNDDGKERIYNAEDVVDLVFMQNSDMIGAKSPVMTCAESIAQAIATTAYGSKMFRNGGMPPFILEGPFEEESTMRRAKKDVAKAAKDAYEKGDQMIALPLQHKLKELGFDPSKLQMVELRRFLIEEIARIYQLPPFFLQDLSNANFSNSEQQDLHLVKHTLRRHIVQFEQQLNLKLFGQSKRSRFVEVNVDGLLRGDFKTRMDGYATAIQNSVMAPDEVRSKENLPKKGGVAGDLLIQGATVPLGSEAHLSGKITEKPAGEPGQDE